MYGVYLCGVTDCFLSAVFFDEAHTDSWGKLYSTNPEGYLVRKVDLATIERDAREQHL